MACQGQTLKLSGPFLTYDKYEVSRIWPLNPLFFRKVSVQISAFYFYESLVNVTKKLHFDALAK
jgi:hypothetical protein